MKVVKGNGLLETKVEIDVPIEGKKTGLVENLEGVPLLLTYIPRILSFPQNIARSIDTSPQQTNLDLDLRNGGMCMESVEVGSSHHELRRWR